MHRSYCAAFKLVKLNHHPKKLVSILDCTRNVTQPRTGGGGRVRGSVAGLTRRGRVGFSRFHGRLAAATRARRSPAVHPRGTFRALGGALAPSAGPLCAAHLAYSQPIHTGPCRMCVRPPRENPPNDRLHPTHDPGSSRSPDPRPSTIPSPARRLDYSSITVGSEGVRLMARARPL